MFSSCNSRFRSGFVIGSIAALVIGFSSGVYAQSPLTIQPAPANRVGVNNPGPQSTLDVDGTVHVTGTVNVGSTVTATGFIGDGSQLTNLPVSATAIGG